MTQTQSDSMSNDKLIESVTLAIWEKDDYSGETTIPSFKQIQAFTAEGPGYDDWVVFVLERPRASRYDVRSIDEDTQRLELARRIMLERSFTRSSEGLEPPETAEEQIWAMANILHKGTTVEDLRQGFYVVDPAHFEPIANFMKRTAGEPTPERLQWIHKAWEKADEDNPELEIPHPLSTIIRAWLHEQTSKHINREYDRKHPVAILRSGSLGSIRDVVLDMEGTGQSLLIAKEGEIPKDNQLVLFDPEPDSILPAILPFNRMWDGRSKKTTRKGAVSHGVRLADEAFFPVSTGEHTAELRFDLGMLLQAFHPDLSKEQIGSNRGKYLKYIINGLAELQYLGWEYEKDGQKGLWVPVKMPEHFMPSINSPDDFTVRLSVELPETQTFNGIASEKYPLRLTGKQSLIQRNALRVAYWIFDRFGTSQVGNSKERALADPTRPVEDRDAEGFLVDADKKRIVTARGKPIENLYHPRAIAQLEREDNKDTIKRYPILSFDDLMRSCYPFGYPPGEREKYIKRSKKAWRRLEKNSFIEIDDKHTGGWRILPSAGCLKAHRGLRKAIKKAKEARRESS